MLDAAPNALRWRPNTFVTPCRWVRLLPVVNHKAVEYAIKIGLALNCEIASTAVSRVRILLPDLTKGFPDLSSDGVAHDGYVDVELEDGTMFRG